MTDASIADTLTRGVAVLRAGASPTPRLDAELLLGHVLDRDRTWVLAHPEGSVAPDAERRFSTAIERRAGGEPVAYIRGFKEWRSLRIRTDPRALIPRPETEQLAEAAIAEIAARLTRDTERVTAWEVATGSGAVAVALALRFAPAAALGRVTLVASDASADALELAAENLAAHGVHRAVTLACVDLLDRAGVTLPPPDVLVANLPYVPTAEVDAGAGSLAHEPRLALDGGRDGLDVLRRLLAALPGGVAPGATVLLEIGAGQAAAVEELAPAGASVTVQPDLAGVDRIVRIEMPR